MKYKVGDKVRIRKDLVVNDGYGSDYYTRKMNDIVKENDYVLTINAYTCDDTEYTMVEDNGDYFWTDEMIERLAEAEPTDRKKFEEWIRKLSNVDLYSDVWRAFDKLTYLNEDEKEFEEAFNIVADYLFGVEKKKMTKAEIEAELGYEIEIVEE